ncbi:hypothetical protein TRFO_12037 [Tritrichomonas foetus]|uniref:Ubiquitin-like domain-containing protein n=1 Tax=Tritrichomonas foetus TaxID=1144522 RepID=A0A1J4J7L5_9EUKA|nr:hypothetical protein TRFO_12037 [Tritrichomonas foetus]|eukprot:OHS93204.1 hypothetical protein TRFO_12037 [Tritrichomonas foetus]
MDYLNIFPYLWQYFQCSLKSSPHYSFFDSLIVNQFMLSLRLLYPGHYLAQIEVIANAKISNLRNIVDDPEVYFYFNGCFLHESKPFNFYNMNEKDTIIVVPHADSIMPIGKFLELISDKGCQEALEQKYTPLFCKEVSKLRDLEMVRLEIKPRLFRKVTAKIVKSGVIPQNIHQTFAKDTVINEPADMPNTEPLPVFF